MPDSLHTVALWVVTHQAPLFMEFSSKNAGAVGIPFSRGSSWPRDWTWFFDTAGRIFTIWATRIAPFFEWHILKEALKILEHQDIENI